MNRDDTLSSRLGIFARTFRREEPGAVAAAVARAGFALAHWNFAAIGVSTLAEGVGDETFARVRAAFDAHGVGIPSVSATYNLVQPDRDLRRRQTAAAVELIARVPLLGATVATLCTGTLDTADMWSHHPGNAGAASWSELRASLDVLLAAASEAGIQLGIEPEPGNIVRDAHDAVRLLDELGPDAPIGIVFDPANLLTPATAPEQEQILTEAIDLLGPRIIGAHAKDVVETGRAAAGAGALDYRLVFRLLGRLPPLAIIAQDVDEPDATRVRCDLLRWHREAAADPDG